MEYIYLKEPWEDKNNKEDGRDNFHLIRIQESQQVVCPKINFNRLFYVNFGKVKITMDDKISIFIESGEFIFLPITIENLVIYALAYVEVVILQTLRIYVPTEYFNTCNPVKNIYKANRTLVRLFSTIDYYHRLGFYNKEFNYMVESILLLLLKNSLPEKDTEELFNLSNIQIVDFQSTVLSCIKEVPTVIELAERMNMEKKHFQKTFKRYFGITPYQFILQQKADIVRSKLLNSKESLKKIAIDLGFSSTSHLNSYCKKIFNKTAKSLRGDKEETNTLL